MVYFDTRGQNGRLAHCKCENAARTCGRGRQAEVDGKCCIFTRALSESPVWPHVSNHIFLYKLMRPELAHRLQTSKMRRNSTSFNSCQYDNINIVTVSVARRRRIAPFKPRRPCVKHFTTFYAVIKHVSPKSDY